MRRALRTLLGPMVRVGAEVARMRTPPRYKVICVSMYRSDLDELDRKVEALKDRGWTLLR
jgi:hypothetical protein